MGKKGIKVKDLARELGVTSRELIERCRAEGVVAQNSITKLDRDMELRVRGWFGLSFPARASPATQDTKGKAETLKAESTNKKSTRGVGIRKSARHAKISKVSSSEALQRTGHTPREEAAER